jgi:hypothetical protein
MKQYKTIWNNQTSVTSPKHSNQQRQAGSENWFFWGARLTAELPNAWDISAPHRLKDLKAMCVGNPTWDAVTTCDMLRLDALHELITRNGNGKVPCSNVSCKSSTHRGYWWILHIDPYIDPYRSIFYMCLLNLLITLFWRVPCMNLWAAVDLPTLRRVWLLFRHFFTSRRRMKTHMTWANINSHSMEDHEIMEDPLKFQYFQWTPRLVQRMSWHDTPQWPQVALSIGLNYWTGCTATGLLPHALWVLRLEPVACTGQFGCSAGKRQRNVAWPNYLHHLPSWGFPIVSPRSNAF